MRKLLQTASLTCAGAPSRFQLSEPVLHAAWQTSRPSARRRWATTKYWTFAMRKPSHARPSILHRSTYNSYCKSPTDRLDGPRALVPIKNPTKGLVQGITSWGTCVHMTPFLVNLHLVQRHVRPEGGSSHASSVHGSPCCSKPLPVRTCYEQGSPRRVMTHGTNRF